MNWHDWHFWGIVGILLLIVEIFTPGFLLACFSIGCFAAVGATLLGGALTVQIITFCIFSILSLWLLRPIVVKRIYGKSAPFRTNMDALLGRTAIVVSPIHKPTNIGQVKIDGDIWQARCLNDEPVEQGRQVEVIRYESNILIIRPK